eukprot:TRINITY_DN7739_c0_g1_i6.p1 TRINITY_DN7739_c0_g1~~TRINITY_DN7739_c0_g1_i6.p1  ORF type:complete len:150 (-),score=32.47 TRINITY_DN7739_c0_g1_i6:134-583(-)
MAIHVNPGKNGPKKMTLTCNVLIVQMDFHTAGCLASLSADNKITCLAPPEVRRTDKGTTWMVEDVDLTENIYFYLMGDLDYKQETKKKSVGPAFIAILMILIVAVVVIAIWKKNHGESPEEKEKFMRDEENPHTDVQLDEIEQRERRQD